MKLEINKYEMPEGFRALGFIGKIKNNKKDMALLYSETASTTAAVFTKNLVKAPCIKRNIKLLSNSDSFKCVVINSGNANACTGKKGEKDNITLAEHTASLLGIKQSQVLTAATGVIGVRLPLNNMLQALTNTTHILLSEKSDLKSAASAILTTDKIEKNCSIKININNTDITISGIAKGSGMIHPDMATMLGFIITDANISKTLLQTILDETVKETFNMISVDGDTSTNDMVLLLANGKAANPKITEENNDYIKFKEAVFEVSKYLAKSIARDGEGASKLIEVEVNSSSGIEDSKKIAKSVISSSLVKTAIFGGDPNWGRIIAAMGYSGAIFDPGKVSIYFQGSSGYVCVMENGEPHHFDKLTAAAILKEKNIYITITIDNGKYTATAWGCDLTYDYVKINADYHT